MPVEAAQLYTTVGFTVVVSLGVLLTLGAYWNLRRTDDVVLRARMYMNRRRLFAGFLALAIGMLAIFAAVLISLGYYVVAGEAPPSAIGLGLFAAFFAFLSWAFYNFWALARTPRAGAPAKTE